MTMTIEELREHQRKSAQATVNAASKQEKKKDWLQRMKKLHK